MANEKINRLLILVIIVTVLFYFLKQQQGDSESELDPKVSIKKGRSLGENSRDQKKSKSTSNQAPINLVGAVEQRTGSGALPKINVGVQVKEILMAAKTQERNPRAAKFKLEDGLVTIAGDIVLGVPKVPDFPSQGWIEIPEFAIWESAEIPFHIQPNLPNQDRIYAAFEIFKDSPVHFVALTDQADAIVFEEKPGTCKSYVGKLGGLQPIWIGAECSPVDIAHEIMHVLGFIHEQNRVDRDNFIEIVWENIKEEYLYNFDLLPDFFMKVSGEAAFDFGSLMIYPPSSFAKKNGLITIKSKQSRQIKPSLGLSPADIERLQKFYGQ
jgi:hypothetical protein